MFNCRKNFNGFNFVQNHTFLKFFNAWLLLFTSLLELIIENLKLPALSIFLQNDLWKPLICEIWLIFHLTYSGSVFDFISKPVIWFAVQILRLFRTISTWKRIRSRVFPPLCSSSKNISSDHAFSAVAKFSEKLTYAHACVY